MNFEKFKKKYPYLFWRDETLSSIDLLRNIVQLENKNALKDFIKELGFDKTKLIFLQLFNDFATNPFLKLRFQKMYNWFIFYKKKQLGLISDMRKYRFWWTKKEVKF